MSSNTSKVSKKRSGSKSPSSPSTPRHSSPKVSSPSAEECPCCLLRYGPDKVTCGCGFSACRGCYKKFILGGKVKAGCMDCKSEWSVAFIKNNFSKWQETKYKSFLENLYMEEEKSKIPALLERIGDLTPIKEEKTEFRNLFKKHRKLIAKIEELEDQVVDLESALENLQVREMDRDAGIFAGASIKNKIISRCPFEECRGLISKTYVCLVDSSHVVCRKCWEPLLKNHKCKISNKKSVKNIEENTRACPTCGARVFKIEGCSQMWCTQCKIGFDYHTGEVVKHVHNPHLTEHRLNSNDGSEDQEECQFIDVRRLSGCAHLMDGHPLKKLQELYDEELLIGHRPHLRGFESTLVQIVDLCENMEFRLATHRPISHDNLTIDYLTNFIDEEKYKELLYLQKVAQEEAKVKVDVYETGRILLIDQFNFLLRALKGVKNKDKAFDIFTIFLRECKDVRMFLNETLKDLLTHLEGKHIYINKSWRWSDDNTNPRETIEPWQVHFLDVLGLAFRDIF